MTGIAVDIYSEGVRIPAQVERWPPEVRWSNGRASIIVPFSVTVAYARSLYDVALLTDKATMRAVDGRTETEYVGLIGNLRHTIRWGADLILNGDFFVSDWPTTTELIGG
jgi:hypothetical protein